LFCDNGSEFTGQMMDLWAYRNGVKIDFSRPGKPTDRTPAELAETKTSRELPSN
jgi:putative transposase